MQHDDRDIEFHDLLDELVPSMPSGDMGSASCEMMARQILDDLDALHPGRILAVEVWEDNEAGARVTR